jgi:hypothetical protein
MVGVYLGARSVRTEKLNFVGRINPSRRRWPASLRQGNEKRIWHLRPQSRANPTHPNQEINLAWGGPAPESAVKPLRFSGGGCIMKSFSLAYSFMPSGHRRELSSAQI